ncbi:MAG: hypothetical protein R8P61_00105 [Bacteroidia bacterium]|nr:hypothetical protein [Bacteroidia bacterium]
MSSIAKEKTRNSAKGDRMQELEQKVDLLLKKVDELQATLGQIDKHYKPLIN